MMNRRGHVGTILMPIIALVIVIAAFLVMSSFDKTSDSERRKLFDLISEFTKNEDYVKIVFNSSAEKAVELADKDNFVNSFSDNFVEIVDKRDLRIEGVGNFFGKVRNREFRVVEDGEGYVVKIDNVLIISKIGKSEIRREIDLEKWITGKVLAK